MEILMSKEWIGSKKNNKIILTRFCLLTCLKMLNSTVGREYKI